MIYVSQPLQKNYVKRYISMWNLLYVKFRNRKSSINIFTN
ncbi:hypothetical protein pb186bvf_014936 [Paramecium bursaria]